MVPIELLDSAGANIENLFAGSIKEINISCTISGGDVNWSDSVDLKDFILTLQVISCITPSQTVYESADVNGDGEIGIEETIYILQSVSGLRQ